MNITQAMTYLWIRFLFDISLFSLKYFLEILYYEICVVKKRIYFISFHIKLNFTVAFLLIRMTNLPVRRGEWGILRNEGWGVILVIGGIAVSIYISFTTILHLQQLDAKFMIMMVF